MLLVRFVGEHAARQALAKSGAKAPGPEGACRSSCSSRRTSTADAGSSTPPREPPPSRRATRSGWGLFGVAWGAIVGFAGDGGVLGSIESGVVTGVLWALFGLSPAPCTACGRGAGCPPGG